MADEKQIWLTVAEVIEMGMQRATLFWQIQKGKLVVRRAHHGPRAKNGRVRREIALASLPSELQARYLKSRMGIVPARSAQEWGQSTEGGAADNGSEAPSPGRAIASDLPAASLSPTAQSAEFQISNLKSQTGNPLARMNEKELEELTKYAEALQRAQGKPRKTRAWIARQKKVSLTTLDRDVQRFRVQGLKSLIRNRRADAGKSRIADESVIARIQSEYLQLHRPTAQAVYEKVKKDFELSNQTPPSFTWVLRQVEAIPKKMISRYRLGEKHYRDHYEYSSTRRRPEHPREWVDADHHEADHYVVFPDDTVGRPFITALHDLCTSEILALRIPRDKRVGRGHAPGALDIGLAVRMAILKKQAIEWPSFGLFENFYHDLGKDFLSSHLRAVLADLHIRPVPCRGYHGQSKPIERWFRTLENGTRDLPGYCGNKPENNPYRSGVRPQPPDPKTLMTLEEYETAIIEWVVKKYHHAPSQPLGGLSPLEALAAHVKNGFTPREVRDERALDLLLMRRARRAGGELVKVRKDGFRLFGRLYFHPELAHLVGEEIDPRYDESNLGEIICYYKECFVCVATNKKLLDFGATKADLARANEIRREQRRRDDEWLEERAQQAQYKDPLARARAERNYDEVMEEERLKIAAGATAQGVPVLMPKYASAVKRLGRQQAVGNRQQLREAKKSQSSEAKPRSEEQGNPYLETKKLSSREIFKREENPYLEDGDEE